MASSRPSPAILGAILLHAGVVAMFFVQWPQSEADILPTVSSVPVSIVSDIPVAAAAPDNPSEEPVTEDAATAPVEAPPEPTPPAPTPPTPAPPPPKPTPAPTPRPTPPRPTPPQPTPPRPTPPRPTPPRATPTPPRATPTPPRPAPPSRTEPSLDLDSLAGPRRPAPTPGPRAPTGQQGQGQASQAMGQQVAGAILQQASENWNILCDIPGGSDMRITMDVTLGPDGSITRGPTLVSPSNDPAWRAQADGAIRAMRQTAPFDVPPGFRGGNFRPTFITARKCRDR